MSGEINYIVSGLPRSGTSMVMKMVEAGGIEALTDGVREADVDNPMGYYEFERVKRLPGDTEWLEDARGKVVKVLAELVKELPEDHTYRIIFIERNMAEILASQKKMLIRRGEDPDEVPDELMAGVFGKYLEVLKDWIGERSNVEVLYVRYNDIMENPKDCCRRINGFVGGILDENRMMAAVDRSLYRNRA